jgi:sporulation protein YlmC with PRC-barrel domain
MLKTLMVTAAASALMLSGAVAQEKPSTNQQAAKSETSSPHFVKEQGADHFVFSKFKGTNVIGPDNAKVGDVTDMLFDKNGKIMGLIVGVGGFLGIGEKNVAIAMDAFQMMPADTGTTGSAGSAARDHDPTDVKLKVTWTKDQLKNAPDFQYYLGSGIRDDRHGAAHDSGPGSVAALAHDGGLSGVA